MNCDRCLKPNFQDNKMQAQLCLNMIVKNESARIVRALDAAKPFIKTFAILDTGSTDDTISQIMAWSAANDIHGVVASGEFHNFSQARNDALVLARNRYGRHDTPYFNYLLLQDADMVIQGDVSALDEIAGGAVYEIMQKAGTISYANPRIISVHSFASYVGVTHEFLNAPTSGVIKGLQFLDHADGANRPHKFQRDIALLTADLRTDPSNARSWFYLGNSYRDAGKYSAALKAYKKRLELGGWDEENYMTQCYIAYCYRDLKNNDQFITEMLKAYDMRPSRAEALYEIAKHYRVNGKNAAAMVFVEAGLTTPKPDDRLFVDDFIHAVGFREEYSIAGFYQDATRETAYQITNGLAVDPSVPEVNRKLARSNMVHYLPQLVQLAPTAKHSRIQIAKSPGFIEMNPSICQHPGNGLDMNVRTVNYKIDSEGRYMIGDKGCQDAPIVTENYLVRLMTDLSVISVAPIQWNRPPAQFPLVIGLEDMRMFWYQGERHFVACVREQSASGQCEQVAGILSKVGGEQKVASWWRLSDPTRTEKNWGPLLGRTGLNWMYRLNEIITPEGEHKRLDCHYAVDNISGSSQWIEWRGGYLAVVHESIHHPTHGKRVYQHRFAFYDTTLTHLKLSLPFVFQDVQIEFCAGLASHPTSSDLVVSYGVRDEEAWLTRLCENDVSAMLWGH